MIIYLTIASLYASKPSKIPSIPKVGKELYELYCAGCHGEVDSKIEKNKENETNEGKKAKKSNEIHINDESQNEVVEVDPTKNTLKKTDSKQEQRIDVEGSSAFQRQSSSSPIIIKDKKEIPSLTENPYTKEEWMKWVLQGEGMMPGYSEILHATDAIKIKTYLDGL